jgi:hypothetical protein
MAQAEVERRDRERQQDLARLRGLRPIDDDFMRCIFRDNLPLAQLVLRILTGKQDLTVTDLATQKDLKRLVGARSICLDAYATDSEGRKYDLEVQRADHGAGKHRARYHASCMDVENLDAGQAFDALPDTYTIFISEHDIFKLGKALYPVERVNLGTGEMFDDGEHILYVNGQYRDDTEIGRLMHDFSCWDPDDMNYDLLRAATRYYKENPKGVEIMCRAFEETRNEGAMRQAAIIAERLIEKGQMTLEAISEITDLPLSKVQELADGRSA